MTDPRKAAERIARAFRAQGISGSLHAVDLSSGAEVAVEAHAPRVLASVFKVPLAVALFRAQDEGALDLSSRREIGPDRTAGPTGTSAMLDPAELSLRDLAYLALAVSDNAAADTLLDLLGADAVNTALAALGLNAIAVRHACRDFASTMLEDTGAEDVAQIQAALVADPSLLGSLRVRDPGRTNAATATEVTRLLGMIWGGEAASPESCAAIRRLMRHQVWPHRLAAGFPEDRFTVAAKTGTLPGIRNDVGVIEDADGPAYAVAVFTVAEQATPGMPQIDALIGATARMAVDALSTNWRS